MILSHKDVYPVIEQSVFIADNAYVIGNVVLGKEVSVWFNAVIRGDVNYIRVGERTNIQDGCVLHVTHNKYPLNIGAGVTIGHNATVHGCTIKDNVLIGMGAIVLDNSVVNSNSIVAAGSLIKESFIVPEGVLAAGVPAKLMRDLTEEEIKKIERSAINYTGYAKDYKNI